MTASCANAVPKSVTDTWVVLTSCATAVRFEGSPTTVILPDVVKLSPTVPENVSSASVIRIGELLSTTPSLTVRSEKFVPLQLRVRLLTTTSSR